MNGSFCVVLVLVMACTGKSTPENPSLTSGDSVEASVVIETPVDNRDVEEEKEKMASGFAAYDGIYILSTESEGAEGKLVLRYRGYKQFDFIF